MEFPGGQLTAPGFERLLSLSDQGVVDILDMEFITKDTDGKSKKSCGGQFRARPGSAPSAAAMGRTGPRERGSGACTATAAVRGPADADQPHASCQRQRQRRGQRRAWRPAWLSGSPC